MTANLKRDFQRQTRASWVCSRKCLSSIHFSAQQLKNACKTKSSTAFESQVWKFQLHSKLTLTWTETNTNVTTKTLNNNKVIKTPKKKSKCSKSMSWKNSKSLKKEPNETILHYLLSHHQINHTLYL